MVQKQFLLKFLFLFESYIESTDAQANSDMIKDVLNQLARTIAQIVNLDFLKLC